ISKLAALIQSIPTPVMGGISLLLFGIIAASGIRMHVEAKIDYANSQNLILSCVVLVIGISGASVHLGKVELTGMGLATIVAIILSLFFKILDILILSNELVVVLLLLIKQVLTLFGKVFLFTESISVI